MHIRKFQENSQYELLFTPMTLGPTKINISFVNLRKKAIITGYPTVLNNGQINEGL